MEIRGFWMPGKAHASGARGWQRCAEHNSKKKNNDNNDNENNNNDYANNNNNNNNYNYDDDDDDDDDDDGVRPVRRRHGAKGASGARDWCHRIR